VSSFWITNPDNTYRDNVAAGSDANGFWMSLPEHPNGAFQGTDASKATWPRRTPVREFKGNVAHSNYDGFMLDRNIAANNTFSVTGSSHQPKENPAEAAGKTVESVFADHTAYQNRNGGIWGRGEMHSFINLKLADNAMGFTHASGNFGRDPYTSRVVNSLFVGESENIGNPQTSAEKSYGRSLPKPQLPDFPIRGYEYYDYRHDVQNSTFVNYQDNATRKTGAISYLLFTSFGVSTENAVEGAKFINAKPVYFPPLERKWGNDNGSSAAWKVAAIHDKDGSVGGVRNAYILINDGAYDSIAADAQACEVKASWNAAVCKGDIGRLNFAAGGGVFGAGQGAPPPAPVVLSRNGRTYPVLQNSNVRSGTEIVVTTERASLNLNLTELDSGSWVMLQLPGFTSAASGMEQASVDELRKANETSYYKDKDALWVKLVSDGSGASVATPGSGTSIQVSK
jgi:cell migration-inducing and hyaluronan-binding protein